jgi:hypothetical protein
LRRELHWRQTKALSAGIQKQILPIVRQILLCKPRLTPSSLDGDKMAVVLSPFSSGSRLRHPAPFTECKNNSAGYDLLHAAVRHANLCDPVVVLLDAGGDPIPPTRHSAALPGLFPFQLQPPGASCLLPKNKPGITNAIARARTAWLPGMRHLFSDGQPGHDAVAHSHSAAPAARDFLDAASRFLLG